MCSEFYGTSNRSYTVKEKRAIGYNKHILAFFFAEVITVYYVVIISSLCCRYVIIVSSMYDQICYRISVN